MRHMGKRQQSGQSAVLLAFMILVLVAMVALSVDVGNAYGQQRRVQSMSNAGAMAGMASALANNTNNGVWTDVKRALSGNRAQNNSAYTYRVDYILDNGTVELLGEWNGSMEYLPNGNSYPPSNLGRVQVTMTEDVKTKFAGVVGRPSLGVAANAVACLGDYGYGVYPLAVPQALRGPTYTNGKETEPGHRIYLANGQELPTSDPRWGKWSQIRGMTIRIPVANQNEFISGVHVPWLNWGGDTQTVDGTKYTEYSGKKGASELKRAFTEPGTLHEGFLEAISPDSAKPNIKPIGTLQRGDWISGSPGVRAGVEDQLDVLQAKQTKIMLPIYDAAGGSNGSKAAYHMVNMGSFVVRQFALTGGTKYIDLVYLGDANASPTECGSEMTADSSVGGGQDKRFNIKGEVKANNRVWRSYSNFGTTYDIVIVMDTSGSMNYDWNDRAPSQSGKQARLVDAKKAIVNFVQGYDVSPVTGDPDARIAFVTFSGLLKDGDPAIVQQGFTTACNTVDLALDCGGKTKKWATIQTKANAMTADGGTPGPIAFEEVETLLQQKRTPPAGKKYGQIVIFATDGVFNICGKDKGLNACVYGQASTNTAAVNTAPFNMESGRPIWQGQQVANRLKNAGARIFIIALVPQCLAGDDDCFDPTGLKDMSSGSNYYYQADDSAAMAGIYDTVREKINYDTCVPGEVTQPAAGASVLLTKPDNPTWSMRTVTDSAGAFQFGDLLAGQYVVKVEPSLTLVSPEDGLKRTYSRTRNGRSLSEEGQASAYISPQYPDGATVSTQLLLSLPLDENGSPHNGCTMPAP